MREKGVGFNIEMFRPRRKYFYIWLGATVLFFFIIFIISDMPYEKQDIKPTLEKMVDLDGKQLPRISFRYDNQFVSSSNPYAFIEFVLRKLGHIIGYFFLTILLLLAIKFTSLRPVSRYFLGGSLAICLAIVDEWHQTFVPGRTGHLIDVFVVDAMGVVIGMLVVLVAERLWRRRQD
ncbi:VanZ family protein [Aquibacillus albus]|uniref:VanZ family protein n=1 Tax=Aquibacillus albus TaxID=1168171 RepID=A0ABS2N5Q6_9BACI|nr:VanZ family protein [Aquibacillus albus]MBM7573462.1 VanZ family protein [Aquibacillus albus]